MVARPGRPWSEGFVLCVTGQAPAQVTGVRFAKGSGVRIHRYAVRRSTPSGPATWAASPARWRA
jgi:hypothetical protein